MVFPYCMRVGGGGIDQMQIRVPVDDTTTWFVLYTVHRPEGARFEPQATIPDYELPWLDEQGNHIVDYVEGQDIMAWVTQGPITDRTVEHLGKSDVGIAMLRKQFKQQLAAVAAGRDPIAVVRDPAANQRIDLPCEKNKFGAGAEFAIQWINLGFSRHSPQLPDLLRLHEEAAGTRAAAAADA
jgi:5,5'-dehydrodivanillate O-demethylase oxygenase subunit